MQAEAEMKSAAVVLVPFLAGAIGCAGERHRNSAYDAWDGDAPTEAARYQAQADANFQQSFEETMKRNTEDCQDSDKHK